MKRIWKFCKRCNSETERYDSGSCKICVKADRIANRLANADKEKQKNRERAAKWRLENREESNKRQSEYYAKNADKIKAQKATKYLSNPDKFRSRRAELYAENPHRFREYTSKWKASNKLACRMHDHNRRANKRNNGGKLSKGIVEKLIKLQRGKCACCLMPLANDYHLDHIVPIKLGGQNIDSNIQLLHSRCNLKKNAKHPIDFMQQRGFLL